MYLVLPGDYWASLLTGQGFGALGLFVLGAGCCLHPGVARDEEVELIPFAYLSYHHFKVGITSLSNVVTLKHSNGYKT